MIGSARAVACRGARLPRPRPDALRSVPTLSSPCADGIPGCISRCAAAAIVSALMKIGVGTRGWMPLAAASDCHCDRRSRVDHDRVLAGAAAPDSTINTAMWFSEMEPWCLPYPVVHARRRIAFPRTPRGDGIALLLLRVCCWPTFVRWRWPPSPIEWAAATAQQAERLSPSALSPPQPKATSRSVTPLRTSMRQSRCWPARDLPPVPTIMRSRAPKLPHSRC